MSKLEDRRKEARELVVSFTLVYEATQGKLLGYLRDLNTGGAQISGNKALALGAQVSLSIELPSDMPANEQSLVLKAKVVRCTLVTEEPPNYELGFEFVALEPAAKETIDKLLSRYYFRRSWAQT